MSSLWERSKVTIIIALFVMGLPVLCGMYKYVWTVDTYDVRVRKLNRKDGDWIVLTDKGAFWNKRDTFWWKCSSTPVQSTLEEKKCYRIKVQGIRLDWQDWYPNVVKVIKEIKCKK